MQHPDRLKETPCATAQYISYQVTTDLGLGTASVVYYLHLDVLVVHGPHYIPCMAGEQHRTWWLNHGFTSHADTGPAASRSPFADKGVSCSSVGKSWGVCSFTWAGATRRAPNLSVPGHVVSESAAVAKPCACLQLKTASTTVVPLSRRWAKLCCPGMFASFCHLFFKKRNSYICK